MIHVDATLRAGKVKSVNQSDGDWHRESARQIGGWTFGALFGGAAGTATSYAGKVGAAKLGLALIGGGPLGWILLGCVVVVSAGVALVVGMKGGDFGEDIGDWTYRLFY